MNVGHDNYFRLHITTSISTRSRRHASVADKFGVAQGADTVEVTWRRNIALGVELSPMALDQIQFVEIRGELRFRARQPPASKDVELVAQYCGRGTDKRMGLFSSSSMDITHKSRKIAGRAGRLDRRGVCHACA